MANWRSKLKEQLETAESPELNSLADEFCKKRKATVTLPVDDIEMSLSNLYQVPFSKLEPVVNADVQGFSVYFKRSKMQEIAPVLNAAYIDGNRKQLRLWVEQKEPNFLRSMLPIIFFADISFFFILGMGIAGLFIVTPILAIQVTCIYFSTNISSQKQDIVSLLDHFCKSAHVNARDIHLETQMLT